MSAVPLGASASVEMNSVGRTETSSPDPLRQSPPDQDSRCRRSDFGPSFEVRVPDRLFCVVHSKAPNFRFVLDSSNRRPSFQGTFGCAQSNVACRISPSRRDRSECQRHDERQGDVRDTVHVCHPLPCGLRSLHPVPKLRYQLSTRRAFVREVTASRSSVPRLRSPWRAHFVPHWRSSAAPRSCPACCT